MVVADLVVHVAVLMVVIACLVQYNMHMEVRVPHMVVPERVFRLMVLFMVLRPMDMAWL